MRGLASPVGSPHRPARSSRREQILRGIVILSVRSPFHDVF